MSASRPLVAVVDDDESVRESLPDLLIELGYRPAVFSSAESFLASDGMDNAECLLLDVAMPGMTGPELLQELAGLGRAIPVIFITAQRGDTVRQDLIGLGAIDCLFKPFGDTELKSALSLAFR
ncbi:two-component system response regulator [Mesorhizobium sp. WSM3862]|nr:two-component system response regulator [Mesorhizobium sp. WSM3862]